jgi:hypothetical protein
MEETCDLVVEQSKPDEPKQPTLLEDIDKDINNLSGQLDALNKIRNFVAVNPTIQEFNRMMMDYNSKYSKMLF